jgi:hypothetical protein
MVRGTYPKAYDVGNVDLVRRREMVPDAAVKRVDGNARRHTMTIKQYLIGGATVIGAIMFAASSQAALTASIDPAGATATMRPDIDMLARKGGDDTKKDDKGGTSRKGHGRDDGRNHAGVVKLDEVQVARRGADDAPGHVRKGRGRDDAPGHVRHGRGSDDAAGDDHGGRDRNDDHGGRRGGRGSDDGNSTGGSNGGGHGRHGGSNDRS